MSMDFLIVELKSSVNSYDRRDRIMTEIMKTAGVHTVRVRFPDMPVGNPLGLDRMFDVETDGLLETAELCRRLEEIPGVAQARLYPWQQLSRGPTGFNTPSP